MPVPPVCALAAYCTHAITKMNTNIGFGAHMPGIGRQQISPRESTAHYQKLGEALLAAISRDFGKSEQSLGSLPAISAEQVVHVAQIHLRGVVLYQQELANALAIANRDGEDARREERMRIWGYA